jgi:hypothetical protein
MSPLLQQPDHAAQQAPETDAWRRPGPAASASSRWVVDAASLDAWAAEIGRFRPVAVVLRLPDLNDAANERLGLRLNRLASECGCLFGGAASAVAVLAAIAWFVVSDVRVRDIDLSTGAVLLALPAIAALAGKSLAILHARVRLFLLLHELRRRGLVVR